MAKTLRTLSVSMLGSLRDLAPIVVIVLVFQLLVLGQPLPNVLELIVGTLLVVAGLTLFIFGLELGLFPLGETMANAMARKGSVSWLLLFAFSLGFGTTVAEPTLVAVGEQAAHAAAGAGLVAADAVARFAAELRLTVAASVGVAVVVGVLRIIKGWPLHLMMVGGYVLVVLLTLAAPAEIVGIAYDSGGVTTSTITVPLVTALGVGLASAIRGRNPMLDGFGLIAFASLAPILFVMVYGMVRL